MRAGGGCRFPCSLPNFREFECIACTRITHRAHFHCYFHHTRPLECAARAGLMHPRTCGVALRRTRPKIRARSPPQRPRERGDEEGLWLRIRPHILRASVMQLAFFTFGGVKPVGLLQLVAEQDRQSTPPFSVNPSTNRCQRPYLATSARGNEYVGRIARRSD